MASIVCVALEALDLFTSATDFMLEGIDTGAGSITLSDIKLVELQEQQVNIMKP